MVRQEQQLISHVRKIYNENLIMNGSAEYYPVELNGWTMTGKNWRSRQLLKNDARRLGGRALHGNLCFKSPVKEILTSQAYQDVDVSPFAQEIDSGKQTFAFSAHLLSRKPSGDKCWASIEFRSKDGSILDTFKSRIIEATDVWEKVSDTRKAPAGTRSIRVLLCGDVRSNEGIRGNGDTYADDLRLLALPPNGQ